jgi:predicted nucleotidyltransferase
MKALERYTHEDRQKIVDRLAPVVQAEFGENFLAFAAIASFARNEDSHYSDLELIVFVKEMTDPLKVFGIGKIIDGMLIELYCYTPQGYLRDVRDVSKHWIISGSDRLAPIVNAELIAELNKYATENIDERCLKQAVLHWPEVQESAGKVMNAISGGNREGLLLVSADMVEHMLELLSFLNAVPFISFGRFISQAKIFPVKPKNWDHLVDVFNAGIPDPDVFAALVDEVITEFEQIFESRGCRLYDCRDPVEMVAVLKSLVDNKQSLN